MTLIGRRCLAVAHRGAPRVFGDNTVAGITEAIRLGADAVEVDVRVTRDRVAVLHHDATLPLRTWLAPPWWEHRTVADLTLSQVRRRAPWVPTLTEALQVAITAGVPLVLDIGSVAVARACLTTLTGVPDAPAWFCGASGALAWVRSQDSSATVMLSWDGRRPPSDALLDEIAPTFFNPSHRLLSPAAVLAWHRRGIEVSAWTVDGSPRRQELLRWGVNAIISNDVAGLVHDCRSAREGRS